MTDARPVGELPFTVHPPQTGALDLQAVEHAASLGLGQKAGRDGRLYEKALGEKTDKVVAAMKSYDPDATCKLVTD